MKPVSGKPYILLVDDTEANLRVLGALLRAEGWSVAAATRGNQALELISRRLPDLVLLDVMMPEMDGFEVCRRLRAAPATQDLPVLFITALTDEESIVQGFAVGGQDYIAKPFRQAERRARVRTHRAGRETTRRAERQAADLAQLNADKDRFYSIIAHDLRSPLAGMLSLSEAMATSLPEFTPAEAAESMTEMAKAARNLYQLLENLLEWSQLQTGRMECRPESVDVDRLLAELAELFHPSALQKGVKVQLQAQACVAWGDRRMLHAIFRNLLSNALKFTQRGGHVWIKAVCDAGGITLSVRDDGIGIPAESLPRLGRAFEQVATDPMLSKNGTGLGLALVNALAQKHGGKMQIDSIESEGTTVTVTLARTPPAVQAEAA